MHSRPMFAAPALLALTALAPVRASAWAQAPAAAQAQNQTPEHELQALLDSFEAAQQAYYDEYRALYKGFDEEHASDAEKAELEKRAQELNKRDPGIQFTPQFVALAERAKGTEVAAKAWLQVVQIGGDLAQADAPARKALDHLLGEYVQSPSLEPLARQLQYASWSLGRKPAIEALEKLRKETPHAKVKAAAMFALASVLTDEGAEGEQKAQGRQLFLDLQRDYAAVKGEGAQSSYAEMAGRNLFELDHLQLLMQAPDFEAVDQAGAKFKLSDYAGKVVVVDFWGFW